MRRILAVSLCLAAAPLCAHAQTAADSLRLFDLRATALNQDPRAAELELLASQSALRLRDINTDLKPAFSFESQAQYQSDVASIPLSLPGVSIPKPSHDTYDAHLNANQRIYDPSLSSRRAVERAQTAESQARVRTALYSITESVNTAFFTALRSQSLIAELQTTLTDIEAQIAVADARVKAGTALPSESDALRAELLRRRQAVAEQAATRTAAIAVLSDLTGKPIDPSTPLSAPDLSAEVATARNAADLRTRPEYQQFERSRDLLDRMNDVRSAQEKPRLSAFGRAGYGRPGLNPLSDRFDSYWLTGIQLQWSPWNWGVTNRERQINTLQRDIVTSEEKAFTAALRRGIEQDLASIDRLQVALTQDDEIIALREKIFTETRSRYAEAVIISADYVDRQTDVLAARLSRASHRVELAQARAHLLTTLGLEVR
ncbi:MAG TPA: TolC family protein [Gemmatimonadaceae bacterium]|nr:TolC family protein [Gemmatimonadaceae bacterium]